MRGRHKAVTDSRRAAERRFISYNVRLFSKSRDIERLKVEGELCAVEISRRERPTRVDSVCGFDVSHYNEYEGDGE